MKPAGTPWIAQIKAVPFAARLPLAGLPTGDYQLRYEILHNDRVVSQGKSLLSRVENLEGRLKTMAERAEQIKDAKSVETATFRHLYQLLTTLNTGRTQETDYPAARLFVEAEAAWQHHQAGQAYYAAVRPGEYWLALPQARSTTVVRAMIPKEAARGQPLPLVIALHGAGGSENLFFDGYGSGKIVPLCQARGWILVAPRSGLGRTNLPEMIDGLSKLYPIDKDRVFLVGHSMGAGQALSAVTANPERYAAVAALGGGGRIRPTKAMETVPFFIGIGTQDFAYSGARALRTSLNNGGVRQVLYKEYPDLEHMVIVQVALPEVMEFFATVKKQAP